jgi:uncharacterized membrane protein YphA (DoxX/SURF4 family)
MNLDPALYYLAACVIALVFLHAGISKLLARDEFRGVLANYRILPEALLAPFAVLLPIAELAAGAGVLSALTRSHAAVLACALLLIYALAMGINLARGRRDIDCGCFRSALKQTISGWLIWRNLVLAAAAAALLLPQAARTTGVLDYVTAGAGGVMLFLCCYALGVLTRRPMTRYDAAFAKPGAARSGWKTL